MTALEPDLRDTVPPPTTVDPSQLVAPELPEIDLGRRVDANLSGQRQSSFPAPAGARVDTTAIVPNLPDAQTAFSRKYARLGPALQNLPGPVRASLVKMDMQRVNKGQYPLSDKETLALVLAAAKKEPTTPAKEKDSPLEFITDLPGAAVRDLTAVARSLPAMLMPTEANPLWQELTSLDDIPEKIQESLDSGDNIITAIANAPGIRFIPGSYVVGNLADGSEGIKELANHPGLAVLDVLPYAGKLAKATKVGKIASNERYAYAFQAEQLAQAAKGAPLGVAEAAAARYAARKAGAHPIWDVLTKRVAEEPNKLTESLLEPNILGRQFARGAETRTGQFLKSAFGRDARTGAGIVVGGEQQLVDARRGVTPPAGELEAGARLAYETARWADDAGIAPERAVQLHSEYQRGTPEWRAKRSELPDVEREYLDRVDKVREAYEANAINEGIVVKIGDETYTPQQAKKIAKARERYDSAVQKVVTEVRPKVDAELEAARNRVAELTTERAKKGAWKRGVARELRQARDDLKRMETLRQLIDDAANPASEMTMADLRKAVANMKRRPTSLASPTAVGTATIPADAVSRVGTLVNLEKLIGKAKNAEDNLTKVTRTPPARWTRLVEDEIARRMVEQLAGQGVAPEQALRIVADRAWGEAEGMTTKAWNKIRDDALDSWQVLKAQGYEPKFVPTLGLGQEGKLYAGMEARLPKLSVTKDRTVGYEAPQYGDLAVSFDAAASDLLRNHINRGVLDEFGMTFGRQWSDVVDSYMDRARRDVGYNARLTATEGERAVRQRAEALARKQWTDWTPYEQAKTKGSPLKDDPTRVVVPRHMQKVLEDSTTSRYGALNVLDPLTGTFRVSVLALSPRWHLYNIVGNSLMLAGTEGPQAFRYAWEARKIIKAARRGEDVLPERIRVSLESGARDLTDDTAFMQTLDGARWRRMLESAPARAGSKLVSGSYRLNGFFDDTTKVMAYESGKRRAMRRGWAPDAAEQAGLDAAQRASAFWVEMTPFERGVLRKVFPFYTFTKKIMGLTLQMPLDHPVRTAILANIAAAEMEDMGEGIPLDWLNSLPLGEPDAQGNQKRVSMAGLNPFSDAPSLFTLKGFLSGLNPAFNTILVQMGATEAGGPLMFGDRVYDPQTGKLVTPAPNPVTSLLTASIPQVGALYRATGADSGFNELARNNPDAAGRMLVGGMGLPTSVRTMNEAEQRMKSELARITAQRDAWRNALSTGDYSEAQNYPALRPLIAQVQALSKAGLMDQYHPYTKAPTLGQAVASQAPWPT